jgi:hypothetical protein
VLHALAQTHQFLAANDKTNLIPDALDICPRLNMRLLFLCCISVLLCTETGAETSLIKRQQDVWMKCLKESYQVNGKRTPDRNAAVEMAFQACTTEEDDLWAHLAQVVPRSSFASLKSAMKQVLLEEK